MNNEPKPERTKIPKKPYRTPNLTHYGTISEITKTTGGTVGMNDMGGGNDKTGFI